MAKGFAKIESTGGASLFVNLKDGDRMTCVVVDEPMLIEQHKLDDADSPYGLSYLCGLKERNKCPVCEDNAGRFTADEKKHPWRCFYPLYVTTITRKGAGTETINGYRLHEGGSRLNASYLACHETLAEFGDSLIGKPIIVTRNGGDTSTTYSVQAHPKADFTIEPQGDAIDAEDYVYKKLDRDWEATPQREDKNGDKPDPFTGDQFDALAAATKGKKLVTA